jgi:hypothetical protein
VAADAAAATVVQPKAAECPPCCGVEGRQVRRQQQYVYTLKLSENDAGIRYFVGRTSDSDIDHRLRQHANGIDPIYGLKDYGCESFERIDMLTQAD